MEAFAAVCDRVNTTSKRLEKISYIAAYLKDCDAATLDSAARFFQGLTVPPREAQPAIGSRTITDAAIQMFHLSAAELRSAYRQSGELGEALAALYEPPLDLGFLRESLTPALLRDRLRAAAKLRGADAARKRRTIVERILTDCRSAREVAVVTKIMLGELRIGLREGLILDAIAQAFERDVEAVRRAAAAFADFGVVAVAAKENKLEHVQPAYGLPIAAMLATPIVFGTAYDEIMTGEWIIEDKFDGIRAQLHWYDGNVKVFSRTGKEISAGFPEILAEAKAKLQPPLIIDGEIIAEQNGHPLPFRMLQPRLARKDPDLELQERIPVAFLAFDLLAAGSQMLLDEPWSSRHARLIDIVTAQESSLIHLACATQLAEPRETNVGALFHAARERGNEGLLLKRVDTPYTPGRRGGAWLKLKRELSTLDVIIVGVEWGHGKRVKMLSDYTFAVRDAKGELVTIGKAYSGLTDAEIMQLTETFQTLMTGTMLSRRTYAVEPKIMIEVAFDVLAPSSLHSSGYALRFPRIVRIRDDKALNECTTLAEVEQIYQTMLDRERKPHGPIE